MHFEELNLEALKVRDMGDDVHEVRKLENGMSAHAGTSTRRG